jgi:putative ATP-binding cassette transporter
VAFLSQRPYVPRGSLRQALSLSATAEASDADMTAALTRVGLGHLAQSLDRVEPWDKVLAINELHRLACARLLLTRPQWVISDEALDVLDDEVGEAGDGLLSIFRRELSGTGVLSFARRASAGGFYERLLHLVGGQARPPAPAPAAPPRPAPG